VSISLLDLNNNTHSHRFLCKGHSHYLMEHGTTEPYLLNGSDRVQRADLDQCELLDMVVPHKDVVFIAA
jgi:hypothetical protein